MGQVKRVVALADPSDFQWASEVDDVAGSALTHIIEGHAPLPPIEKVAINDSSDVHFGNKTYIHGPVVIKQFIKEMPPDKTEQNQSHGNGELPNEKAAKQDVDNIVTDNVSVVINDNYQCKLLQYCKRFSKINKIIILSTIIVIVILLTIIICSIRTVVDDENVEGDLQIVSRKEWDAMESGQVDSLNTPVLYVILSHTVTDSCSDREWCKILMYDIQKFHMEVRSWSDIGYNFVVCGDGAVYEGRGWDTVGAHTKGFNSKGIGIGLMGTFSNVAPPEKQMMATQNLIKLGVKLGKLRKDYKLVGYRQLQKGDSPGSAFFAIMRHWPNFAEKP